MIRGDVPHRHPPPGPLPGHQDPPAPAAGRPGRPRRAGGPARRRVGTRWRPAPLGARLLGQPVPHCPCARANRLPRPSRAPRRGRPVRWQRPSPPFMKRPEPPPTPDFRALFEATPSPYLVLTPQLLNAAVNDAYLAVTGRTREELMGRHLFDAFPDSPDDPQADGTRHLGLSLEAVRRDRGAPRDADPALRHPLPPRARRPFRGTLLVADQHAGVRRQGGPCPHHPSGRGRHGPRAAASLKFLVSFSGRSRLTGYGRQATMPPR